MQLAQPAPAAFAGDEAPDNAADEQRAKDAAVPAREPGADASASSLAHEESVKSEAGESKAAESKAAEGEAAEGEAAGSEAAGSEAAPGSPGSPGANGANGASHAVSLKLRLGAEANGSRRRSERVRHASARSEELRRAREERQAIERARSEARSAAAKKGVKTKRKAAQAVAAGLEPAPKRVPKHVVTLKYTNPAASPTFAPVRVDSAAAFWQRLTLREFLLRFDKLCRVPARFAAAVNDPLVPWTPDLFKAVVLAMLKLIQNDATPLHSGVRTYMTEIDSLEPADPKIWDWLLEFVEQLDAYAPTAPPQTEAERLDLVRRLMVLCTGTETIRITVMSDMDQLKLVEKDAADEVKHVYAKLKATEHKLAKLKQVDKQVHREKVAAAQRVADTKAWRAQQQLYQKLHKFNMRTTPMAVDGLGNKYWSLQYKSKEHAAWGSWIMCECLYDPAELAAWHQRFGASVSRVLQGRDAMIAEKIAERKRHRKEARSRQADDAGREAQPADADKQDADKQDADKQDTAEPDASADDTRRDPEQRSQPKRRYPKLKIDFPKPLPEPRLYYVEGRDNITQLAEWVGGLRGVDPKMRTSIADVANFLAPE